MLVCRVEECCAQCGTGEGEDFDGGREGVALDMLRQVENGDVQVMLQSRTRTVLGTQAAREEAAQERWAPCSSSESLPSPSTSHNHGGQRASTKESNCISRLS